MSRVPGNSHQLCLLLWMLVFTLGKSFELVPDYQSSEDYNSKDLQALFTQADKLVIENQGIKQENPIDLQALLLSVQSSLVAYKQDLDKIKDTITTKLEKYEQQLTKLGDKEKQASIYRHCADIHDNLSKFSGVYTIQPVGSASFEVYCDMTTDNGGWTVFQKRGNFFGIPSNNFNRNWQEYKDGFGDFRTEFWIGLSKLWLMTRSENGKQQLRVDLADLDYNKRHAKYNNFAVSGEFQGFSLSIGSYSGDAGDSLKRHDYRMFSAYDHDQDKDPKRNCASLYSGGWWFDNCHDSCLNCLNLKGSHNQPGKGIEWNAWKGEYYSLAQTEMKIRPVGWTPKKP